MKYVCPSILLMTNSIFGIGSALDTVILFSLRSRRKSMQYLTDPSFFGTRTTGEEYGVNGGSITYKSSIFVISASITSGGSNGMGYPFDRIGSDARSLTLCSVCSVRNGKLIINLS